MRIHHKKVKANGVSTSKHTMYLASLAKVKNSYCKAANRYGKEVISFDKLLVRTRCMSHAHVSYPLVIEFQTITERYSMQLPFAILSIGIACTHSLLQTG